MHLHEVIIHHENLLTTVKNSKIKQYFSQNPQDREIGKKKHDLKV